MAGFGQVGAPDERQMGYRIEFDLLSQNQRLRVFLFKYFVNDPLILYKIFVKFL